jgi:diacylglycerol kinase (ATP)
MPEDILLKYAYDPMVRVLVCGGDGTCGWIASSLDKVWLSVLRDNHHLHLSKYKDHLPMAIMPLGTGNDLSRQFGWGGTFQPHMKKRTMITSVERSKLTHLDTWRCIVLPMQKLEDEEKQLIPKILGESNMTERMEQGDSLGDSLVRQTTAGLLQSLLEDDAPYEFSKSSRRKNTATASEALTQIFDGSFCNYFSLGFDATMAYHFHHDREEHPEKFSSSLKNKIAYLQKSTYALRAPKLRKRVKVLVNNEEGQPVELKVPKNCRAIVSI